MFWTIILEDEGTERLAQISNDFYSKFTFEDKEYKLLKYLDPYGDTIFNRIQMDDLIEDLNKLIDQDPGNKNLILEIISFAERCKSEVHTYLRFYGD